MSTVVMRPRLTKWGLLVFLVLTPVIFYLFLIEANYYYATRADYILQRIRDLKIDDSSIEELKRLGSEHGLRYEAPANCAGTPCAHLVSPSNGWMRSLLIPLARIDLGQRIGLRAWHVAGDILIENGQVTGKIYALEILNDNVFPETQVSASDKHRSEYDSCIYRPLKRHPGYEIHKASNVRGLRVIVSDEVSQENRGRAFQFNLDCLTSWRRCAQLSDFMPLASADFQSDQEWVREHPGEHDPQCELVVVQSKRLDMRYNQTTMHRFRQWTVLPSGL